MYINKPRIIWITCFLRFNGEEIKYFFGVVRNLNILGEEINQSQ